MNIKVILPIVAKFLIITGCGLNSEKEVFSKSDSIKVVTDKNSVKFDSARYQNVYQSAVTQWNLGITAIGRKCTASQHRTGQARVKRHGI